MKISRERKMAEGLERLKELEKEFDLRTNIYKYFSEGKLYYSYLIAGGVVASIDTINYDPRYQQVVQEFEEQYEYLVYHVIETGDSIALLYVGDDETDWDSQRLFEKQYILSYVYRFDEPECSEFGDIVISGLDGALIRIA